MKVVMIGTEKRIFEAGSAAQARIASYGSIVEELHVICFTSPGFKNIQLAPNVYAYPTNSSHRVWWPFRAYRIARRLKAKGIALVSAQDPFESGFAAFLASWALRARFHLQIHTDFLSPAFLRESALNRFRARLAVFLLRRSECVRVVSKHIAQSIERAHIELKTAPFVLPIRTETNVSKGDSSYLHTKYPKFEKFALMVGRLEKEKNTMLGLRAFAAVHDNFPDTALIIVGSGSLQWQLKKEAETLGVGDRVFFEGWQKELAHYYASATLFMFTSHYEGYGLALIEAAEAGLPIVTTDVGIARELFTDSGAYIVPVGDEGAFSRVLSSVLYDRGGREKKAFYAKESVRTLAISEEEYLERYKMAWEKCL